MTTGEGWTTASTSYGAAMSKLSYRRRSWSRRSTGCPAASQCLLAQLRPHPVFAAGRGVALVENHVADLQHRGQPVETCFFETIFVRLVSATQ
jgi:hypothetical protein